MEVEVHNLGSQVEVVYTCPNSPLEVEAGPPLQTTSQAEVLSRAHALELICTGHVLKENNVLTVSHLILLET